MNDELFNYKKGIDFMCFDCKKATKNRDRYYHSQLGMKTPLCENCYKKKNMVEKMNIESGKLEAEIKMEIKGILDEVALRIPMVLNWEEFLNFRQNFLTKFNLLKEVIERLDMVSEITGFNNMVE